MKVNIAARLLAVLGLASATASAVEPVRGYGAPATYYPNAYATAPAYPQANPTGYPVQPVANNPAMMQRLSPLPAVNPAEPRLAMHPGTMGPILTNAPVGNGLPTMPVSGQPMPNPASIPGGAVPGGGPGFGTYPTAPGNMMQAAPMSAPYAGSPPVASSAPQNTWCGESSPYMQAMQGPWDASCCEPAACAPVIPAPACPRWFGGVYGLIMDMQDNDPYYFLNGSADPARLYLNTADAEMGTTGGVEARIGRTFCCCRWGLEFGYWGLYPGMQQTSVTAAQYGIPGFNTTMDYQDIYLDFNGPVPRDNIENWYNGANPIQAAILRRNWEFHNFEINVLSGPMVPMASVFGCGGCGGGCGRGACGGAGGFGAAGCLGGSAAGSCGAAYAGDCAPIASCGVDSNCGVNAAPACGGCGFQRCFVGYVLGFRYFKFNEDLYFHAENDDGIIDYNSPNNEFTHHVNVDNHLAGFQTGLNLDYFLTRCFCLETGSRFGVYGNNTDVYQRVFNTLGPAYTNSAAPDDFIFNDSDNDVAFLGELRTGIGYKIGCHWRLVGGYRMVAATGVARAVNQLPHGQIAADQSRVAIVDRDGSLILHGAYVGTEFAW